MKILDGLDCYQQEKVLTEQFSDKQVLNVLVNGEKSITIYFRENQYLHIRGNIQQIEHGEWESVKPEWDSNSK